MPWVTACFALAIHNYVVLGTIEENQSKKQVTKVGDIAHMNASREGKQYCKSVKDQKHSATTWNVAAAMTDFQQHTHIESL